MQRDQHPLAAVEDWLRVHRQLMERETAFTDLAIRAAAGEIGLDELNAKREELIALRILCTAVYEKAFPKATNPSSSSGS